MGVGVEWQYLMLYVLLYELEGPSNHISRDHHTYSLPSRGSVVRVHYCNKNDTQWALQ